MEENVLTQLLFGQPTKFINKFSTFAEFTY